MSAGEDRAGPCEASPPSSDSSTLSALAAAAGASPSSDTGEAAAAAAELVQTNTRIFVLGANIKNGSCSVVFQSASATYPIIPGKAGSDTTAYLSFTSSTTASSARALVRFANDA